MENTAIMDNCQFGIEKKHILKFSCNSKIQENDAFPDYKRNSQNASKQQLMRLFYVRSESSEDVIFRLDVLKTGEEIVKFAMKQVIKMISSDLDKQRVTFFVLHEDMMPKKGQKFPPNVLDQCLKIFIENASVDSLK